MREILFRGKCVSDGHWVHGLLISIGGELSMLTSNNGLDRAYPVLSETVGQYIGLADKNGRKIFEGDIVKYKEHILQVEYAEEYASYFFHNNGSVIGECTAKYTKEYAEIIGNIHDNPELLEVTQ